MELLDNARISELDRQGEFSESEESRDKGGIGEAHSISNPLKRRDSPGEPRTSTVDQSKGHASWNISISTVSRGTAPDSSARILQGSWAEEASRLSPVSGARGI